MSAETDTAADESRVPLVRGGRQSLSAATAAFSPKGDLCGDRRENACRARKAK